MTNQLETIQQAKEKLVDMSTEFAPLAITALLILIVGYFATRWVAGMIRRWLEKMELEPPLRNLILQVVWVVIMGLFGVIALSQLGVQLLPLVEGWCRMNSTCLLSGVKRLLLALLDGVESPTGWFPPHHRTRKS